MLYPLVPARRAVPVATYATANGERGAVTLTDGSTVILNAASRLDVPANYSSGNRTVRLIGEGLFTVSSHAGHPFTVISGLTKTRVLGTSFVVRHYGTDTTVMVAVRTGKVSVGTTVVTAGGS
jgi:ferric-dicitrate binding protein FerR (iron transport regulator)